MFYHIALVLLFVCFLLGYAVIGTILGAIASNVSDRISKQVVSWGVVIIIVALGLWLSSILVDITKGVW